MLDQAGAASGITAAVPTAARLPWVDAARGFAVCGVVLFHVSLWHLAAGGIGDPTVSAPLAQWGKLNGLIDALRMPVLLSMSGYLASRRIAGGLRSARRPILANAYLYVVWLAVYTVVSVVVAAGMPHRVDGWTDAVGQLLVPDTPLWYLMALVVYGVLLSLLRSVPGWVVVLALTIVSWTVGVTGVDLGFWTKIITLGMFFAIGARFPELMRAMVARATIGRAVVVAVVVVAMIWADRFFSSVLLSEAFERVRGVAVLVGVGVVIAVAVRWGPVRWFATVVGRRTLWIYVLHVPVLQLLMTVLPLSRLADTVPGWVFRVLPGVECVVVIAVCWALGRALTATPARVLFTPPWRKRSVTA